MVAELVVVTSNPGKLEEIRSVLSIPLVPVPLDVSEIQSMDVEEVAAEKAKAAWREIRRPLIVDDTSLYIDGLGRLPGPLVTWFLSSLGASGVAALLKSDQRRNATAETCVALALGENQVKTFVGRVEGEISRQPRGEHGFGFDSIFIPSGMIRTYAEMSGVEKNAISTRFRALEKLQNYCAASLV